MTQLDPHQLELQRRHDARAAAIADFLQPGLKFVAKIIWWGLGALGCALGLWLLITCIRWAWEHPLF